MGDDIDPTNPYDPPERQTLEEQLYHDQQLQSADHQGVLAERHIIDAATAAGAKHEGDDTRLHDLEHNEQLDAAHIVKDQQNIDDWDQAHPGWQNHLDDYQPSNTQPADSDTGDLYASADAQTDGGYDPYASADTEPAGATDGSDDSF